MSKERGLIFGTVSLGLIDLSRVEVPCWYVGQFAVHAGWGLAGFRITHPRSGLALPVVFATDDEAIACAREVDALGDWNRASALRTSGDTTVFAGLVDAARQILAKSKATAVPDVLAASAEQCAQLERGQV